MWRAVLTRLRPPAHRTGKLATSLLLAAAFVGRLLRMQRSSGDARHVETRLLLLKVGGLVAILLYGLQSDLMTSVIEKPLESGSPKLEEALGLFEEGVRLSQLGSRQLDEAEHRLEVLLEGEQTAPFTPGSGK